MTRAEKLTTIAENEQKVYDAGYKKAVEDNCREFYEKGISVRCEPVKNYPAEIVSEISPSEEGCSSVTLTQLGKNLLTNDESLLYKHRNLYVYLNTGRVAYWCEDPGAAPLECWSTDFIPCSHLQGLTLTWNGLPRKILEDKPNTSAGMGFYREASQEGTSFISANAAETTFTVPTEANYMRLTLFVVALPDHQLELGSAITAFEPYTEKTYTVDFDKTVYGGSYNWNAGELTDEDGNITQLEAVKVALYDGVNTLYSNTGDTIVSGREKS